jgi:hypothetical protein
MVGVYQCPVCDETMGMLPSWGRPLTWFRESSPRLLANLDRHTPVRSHGQHVQMMREKGLDYATEWHVSKKPSKH